MTRYERKCLTRHHRRLRDLPRRARRRRHPRPGTPPGAAQHRLRHPHRPPEHPMNRPLIGWWVVVAAAVALYLGAVAYLVEVMT